MAAALRELLVLELHGVGAGALQHADRARDVQRIAEARVGIDDERQRDRLAHGGDVGGKLGERDEADIGHAEIGIGEAGAGDIDGGETQALDEARGERVGRARNDRTGALVERAAQCFVEIAHVIRP